jgi:hypothetical protein
MAYAILGLACLAGDAGDWDQAALLHGAAQAFLTGRAIHVRSLRRATTPTASARCARTWAMSN